MRGKGKNEKQNVVLSMMEFPDKKKIERPYWLLYRSPLSVIILQNL
jgi:hypothetical protein